jgi:hypothetical protein
MEAQAIQFWYGILDKELRQRVRDVALMSDDSPTLAHVFVLFKNIDLNMVEERMVTSRINRDIATTSHGQQSTLDVATLALARDQGKGVASVRAYK